MDSSATAMDLSGVTPESFTPYLGQTFFLEGAQGLRLEVEMLSVTLGKPFPPESRLGRRQPFDLLLAAKENTPHDISGVFLVHLAGFPLAPVFINRVMPPIDREPGRPYLQACFS